MSKVNSTQTGNVKINIISPTKKELKMELKKFKINITMTWSKIMSLMVLIAGTVFSILNKDANVFMVTIAAVTAILGVKQIATKQSGKQE